MTPCVSAATRFWASQPSSKRSCPADAGGSNVWIDAIPYERSRCTGSFSVASDNAYALYINGAYQSNVNGGRTNIACPAANEFGDPYTGCNWQSVDLHEFTDVRGPLTLAVDALDLGGTGGWIGTAVVNGVTYPTNAGWRCFHDGNTPADGWMMPDFVDSDWPSAF